MDKTAAVRQQRYRDKLKAGGKTQKLITVIEADWQAGFDAGKDKKKATPPAGADGFSWMSGYIEGKAKAEKA